MNRPLALVCYICGREFGTKSLGIHIKSCQKKWEIEQNNKPPKQRRPCPQPPPGLQELLAKPNITKQDIIAFNTGSFNTFKEEALMECQYCGRKFNPKSLIPHQKACKTNPMIRKPYAGKNQEPKIQEQSPMMKVPKKTYKIPTQAYDDGPSNLVPCHRCGRTFNPDRIAKHEKICKGPEKKIVPTISEKYEVKQATKPKFGGKMPSKVPKWKAQSEQLQQAMKQMRKLKAYQQKGGNLADLPPPTRSNYDHYVQCRYCGRKYAPDVAERHIPKCANIINKPGGIKPSKIQSKYVGNSGVSKNNYGSSGMSGISGGMSGISGGISGISKPGGMSGISKPGGTPGYRGSNKPTTPEPVKYASKPMMSRKR